MRNPMDVIGAAARSDDAARYGVGLTVLKALRDEYGVAPNPNRIGFAIPVPDWDLADHPDQETSMSADAPPRTADGRLIWIAGTCPACGSTGTLVVGSGGHVTCSLIRCPDPCKTDRMLRLRDA